MGMYFQGQHPGYAHIRSGPDWLAFASNWMSCYERFGDEAYWRKLLTGLESLEEDELGLLAGPTFLYKPETRAGLSTGRTATTTTTWWWPLAVQKFCWNSSAGWTRMSGSKK
jgi:hypothetical protein